jgi:hypothetical protein
MAGIDFQMYLVEWDQVDLFQDHPWGEWIDQHLSSSGGAFEQGAQ